MRLVARRECGLMPTRARRTCPNCKRVLTTRGPCPICRARRDARAPGTNNYNTSTWMARSAEYLLTHPWCRLCGKRAKVADHHPLSRRDLIRFGLDPDTDDRLRPLCQSCHAKETNKYQGGGLSGE